jgi:hypothetical protein
MEPGLHELAGCRPLSVIQPHLSARWAAVGLKHSAARRMHSSVSLAFIPEGIAQRSATLRQYDVQALDGRTFHLMGLRPTTQFVEGRYGVIGPVPRRGRPGSVAQLACVH